MTSIDQITAVIVNYRTLELTRACVESLLHFYPDINIILVDNNSQDASTNYIRTCAESSLNIDWVKTGRNIGHGPGLHVGVKSCKTPYVLTMDSDVEVLRGGWLELMLGVFAADPKLFAIGNLGRSDYSGVRPGNRPLIHPFCALWDRIKYHKLGQFEASGQPVRGVCFTAIRAGYHLQDLPGIQSRYGDPTTDYVKHVWGGTRCQHDR